jgi:hypothetical protein
MACIQDFGEMRNIPPWTYLGLQVHDADLSFIKDCMNSIHTSAVQMAFILTIFQHPAWVGQRK